MALQHRKKPILAPVRKRRREDDREYDEESLILREFRKLDYAQQQEWAARFSLDESDDTERWLLLTVAAVYRKLKSRETNGEHNAPGERFLIELIEHAACRPLHYYTIWGQFREFELDWEQRACAMRLGTEDEQDPNDDDPANHAEEAWQRAEGG